MIMNLREILDNLNDVDRKRLLVAFEDERTEYVEVEPGVFCGVNITMNARFIIKQQHGAWSSGLLLSDKVS